jgi:hypothetical protein
MRVFESFHLRVHDVQGFKAFGPHVPPTSKLPGLRSNANTFDTALLCHVAIQSQTSL